MSCSQRGETTHDCLFGGLRTAWCVTLLHWSLPVTATTWQTSKCVPSTTTVIFLVPWCTDLYMWGNF